VCQRQTNAHKIHYRVKIVGILTNHSFDYFAQIHREHQFTFEFVDVSARNAKRYVAR
jgi:hypothetical protein